MSLSRNEMPACLFNQALGSLSNYHTIVVFRFKRTRGGSMYVVVYILISGMNTQKTKNKKKLTWTISPVDGNLSTGSFNVDT